MKTLRLTVEDYLYDTLLAMLKGLPKQNIKIIEDSSVQTKDDEKPFDINTFSGTIESFSKINDPVAWQKEIRSEWDRELNQ